VKHTQLSLRQAQLLLGLDSLAQVRLLVAHKKLRPLPSDPRGSVTFESFVSCKAEIESCERRLSSLHRLPPFEGPPTSEVFSALLGQGDEVA
jgi:hypothetical protein